jgi:peptide/nickel transport system substrate-binding protein
MAGVEIPSTVIVRKLLARLAALILLTAAPLGAAAEKVFTYAIEGPPESLDFAKTSTERAIRVAWLMCEALVNVSKDGQTLEPGLAESWQFSPDGLSAVMKLRSGVQFHDGTSLDAEAVKASLERQFRPSHPLYTAEPKNTQEQALGELIDDIRVVDRLTLALKLKHPGLHYLSQSEIVSPSALRKLGKAFARNPACTGPYKLESWSAEQIVLVANDQYWGGRPKIDRVVFRFIAEGKAVVDALLREEVDFVARLPDPVWFERLRESPKIKWVPFPGLNLYYLGFYTERAPFNNAMVRRAVAQAINIPRAALFLGRGVAVPAKGALPPGVRGYDPEVTQGPYDAQAAKELLSKSGAGSLPTVRVVHNSALTFTAEVAGAIQSDLRRIGMQVELLGKPGWPEVVAAVRKREGDMFLYSWNVRAPYPERFLLPLFHSRSVGTTNLTHYRNPVLDKLLEDALRLQEGAAQNRLLSQMQRLIVQDAPMVVLYHAIRVAAYSERVQGLELNLGLLPHDKLVKVDLAR